MENFLAKILINDDWYEELSPTALYETEFENIVAEKAKNIFPEYYIAPFKTKVFTDDDVVMPDLAFIDKDYRGWWVVEVYRKNTRLKSSNVKLYIMPSYA